MQEVIVSVIMPAHNAERFIAESIESVIGQSESRWELIVMDDGSTDATAAIVKGYSCNDQRIRYYYQENRGQGNARNNAMKLSNGVLIALLDADDLWAGNKLELQVDCIKGNDADLVYSDMVLIDENGEVTRDSYGVDDEMLFGKEGIKLMLNANRIPASTVVARKGSLLAAGGFDEQGAGHYGEDYALWLRMLQRGAVFRGMKEQLANYRQHLMQSTTRKGNMMHVLEMLQRIEFTDEDLNNCRDKALTAWVGKFVRSNPFIEAKNFERVVAMYPHKAYRILFRTIYYLAGYRITAKMMSLV